MHYPEDADTTDNSEHTTERPLLFDGTAHLDDSDDDRVPRVKGLIELFNLYFGKKREQSEKK